jgi:hypothetical protein
VGCSRIEKYGSGSKFNKELTEHYSRSLLSFLGIDVIYSCLPWYGALICWLTAEGTLGADAEVFLGPFTELE